VQNKVTPVWPLADYVAVNPFSVFSHCDFLETASQLTSIASIELFMPLDYYRQQYRDGNLTRECINTALDEMVADGVHGVESIDVNQILAVLHWPLEGRFHTETTDRHKAGIGRDFNTLTDYIDHFCGAQWSQAIADEVSKYCSGYYDAGQATWVSAQSSDSLFDSWRKAAQIDLSFEVLGVRGFRNLVSKLPSDPEVALGGLLEQLKVPQSVWYNLLLCEAFKLPGWSAWTRYQDQTKQQAGGVGSDFVGLLAIRLAYQLAVSRLTDFTVNWQSLVENLPTFSPKDRQIQMVGLIRYALLKAEEIQVRQRLLAGVRLEHSTESNSPRFHCQMVFCIDVRSERIRRHLEACASSIQTFGFAGFFGLPIEMVPMGEQQGHACVPVLLTPKFKVREELCMPVYSIQVSASQGRQVRRQLRRLWQDFQTSATSCFSFVESMGLWYSVKLIAKSLGYGLQTSQRFDGIAKEYQEVLGPSLSGLDEQGMTPAKLIDLAESILKGIGVVHDFARLVVFCGHGSCGENNPLQAGLDCGACGGHTGEANARLAAKLLNQSFVRQGLAERGIEIPEDTHFLAALHNTTTDALKFFDLHLLPSTHIKDLEELQTLASKASERTLVERQPKLSCESLADLLKRSRDWSEVRPEWGLAGNAAFIAGPRELTKSMTMDGRVFLHSYHYARDPEFKVLEQIMTAPMIVAHWINMQYYASTVAPAHFGSGTKTIHNVVGKFGLLSGNGGDLMTGLPWQSLHDGQLYQHQPVRLLAVVAAPREAISCVLAKNSSVQDSLRNDWMQLVAVEESGYYRYTRSGDWEELEMSQESIQPKEHLMSR
jgi:uncharacterized protein YbcC (UPF0753/DUF2309 family)